MKAKTHIALNAHLLSEEASYRSAGIHGYLYNTLKHLPDVDSDSHYTIFTGKGQLPNRDDWMVERSALPTQNPLIRIIWEQIIAPIRLLIHRPDLLHGMAFSLPMLWWGASVVTIFDLSFIRYPERLSRFRRLYLNVMVRLAVKKAKRVIAISESGKQEIADLLGVPSDKIDVALPGVGEDFAPLPEKQVADFRIRNKLPGRFILHVGTLEPRKNLAVLLRAYAKISQRSMVKLVLVGGKGWQTEPLFRLIDELELGEDVIFPGYVTGESLPLWYNAAELFVYPSVYEGFGLPVLEAMSCGTPVVVSDSSSLPEAAGIGGILLPPDDVAAWESALVQLLDDSSLQQEQSQRGLEWAKRFRWTYTAEQTTKSYRRALKPVE